MYTTIFSSISGSNFKLNDPGKQQEALSTVEKTPSKVKKRRLCYGGTGVVPLPELAETLSSLAARAKKWRTAAGVDA